jgi:hypothetical protein
VEALQWPLILSASRRCNSPRIYRVLVGIRQAFRFPRDSDFLLCAGLDLYQLLANLPSRALRDRAVLLSCSPRSRHIHSSLFLILLISVSQAIGIAHSPAGEKNYLTPVLFLASLLIGPTMMLLARSYPPALLCRLMPRIIHWVLVFLTIECVSRLIFSPYMPAVTEADASDSFYLYKASLFFYDSNFAGIEILCLLAIMFAFRESIGRKKWLLAYLLLFATFSRASIAAGICQLVVYKLWRWRIWTLFGLLAAQVIIIGQAIPKLHHAGF